MSPLRRIAVGSALLEAALVVLPGSGAVGSQGSEGGQLWLARYTSPGGNPDEAYAVVVSPEGSRVFVTGDSYRTETSSFDYGTVAYDASTGSLLWERRYDGPRSGDDYAVALALSPDGSQVFVTGHSDGTSTGEDYATVAYDAVSGSPLWVSRYDGPGSGDDEGKSVAVAPDSSTVFVTGGSEGNGTEKDYATVAYDAGTGGQQWVQRFDGPVSSLDEARSVVVSPQWGSVLVTGYSYGRINGDYATVAYAADTGARLWSRRYDGPAHDYDQATWVAASPDGSKVVVTGDDIGGGTIHLATVAYDAATGSTLWVRRYAGPDQGSSHAFEVEVSPDGSKVFVAGFSYRLTTGEDFTTLAYEATSGTPLWVRHPGRNGTDEARSVAVTPDGSKVFAAGNLEPLVSDYVTLAFDAATGAPLGGRIYAGPGNSNDTARSVAVSPDGSKVFVTGSSSGRSGGLDYVTLAYEI